MKVFIDNFALIYDFRLYIWMNPDYANIIVPGFGKTVAYIGRKRPVTL